MNWAQVKEGIKVMMFANAFVMIFSGFMGIREILGAAYLAGVILFIALMFCIAAEDGQL